ncbi:Flavodoxin reductases (ferredoxin-NADPH reductases) family 1 [Actinokineospora spheciospongiae]|uniref:Flavodoxin reductases (Ferredoxin-NADPH reductases) family 1 n=1 Tax=Actinokineospora spheciospongiae TaxID=909613 RepID=W7J5F4_9PSEU|nr:Flavodoxin reductases (ferredoxin-NADPH reductases) family 1 [Actinokineospora spheciospongiae]
MGGTGGSVAGSGMGCPGSGSPGSGTGGVGTGFGVGCDMGLGYPVATVRTLHPRSDRYSPPVLTVAGLNTFPVKGCAPVPLTRARVGAAGLEHDRAWMVTDPDGTFRSQRRDPRLALVHPRVADDVLILSAPDAPVIEVEVDDHAPARPVTLFGEPFRGIDQGDPAADWLTRVLGRPSRLVRVPPDHDRAPTGLTPGTSGYADSSAVHLLGLASHAELNRRLTTPVPLDRFRANVLVAGGPPHAEDDLRAITVGGVALGYTKPAIRCAVTTVDQATAARTGPEPLRTLATYRRTPEGVAFGVKFAVTTPGWIEVGDEVTGAGPPSAR